MAGLSAIYAYDDFRIYLSEMLDSSAFGRGARLKLANFLGCQPSFISQVLAGKNELSLEHAHKINSFLTHADPEAQYFVWMVLLSRAGTFELQKFIRQQMSQLREHQTQIHNVVEKRELKGDDLLHYYNDWLCVSVHMLATIEAYRDLETLRSKLGVTEPELMEVVSFLTNTGILKVENGRLTVIEPHVHLKKTSPFAQSASVMTRLKVLEKLRLSDPRAVNYTSNFTISRRGYEALKRRILDFVVDLDAHIQSEKSEEFCTLVLDLIEH